MLIFYSRKQISSFHKNKAIIFQGLTNQLTNQQLEKIDSLQEEKRKDINHPFISIRKEMKKITAFTIRTIKRGESDQGYLPFPYIYYLPYSKSPPTASAEAHRNRASSSEPKKRQKEKKGEKK